MTENPPENPQDIVKRLTLSKGGLIFIFQATLIGVSCYSLITQLPVSFHMDQPFNYTIQLSQATGIFLACNAIAGLLLARSILPGLKIPFIECPHCHKPGAYVKSATYHCNDCGEVTSIGRIEKE